MSKVMWEPGTMIYPLPAVMVSCGENEKEYNIITIAWTGTISSNPPMCYISVRPQRHSYEIIKRTGEFVINLTTLDLARATDWCGVRSGKKYNKFKEMNLTPVKAEYVSAPLIKESPINIECKVTEIKPLGVHHMFMANVLAIHGDEKYMDKETGAFQFEKAAPLCYSHGKYYEVGKFVGKFGFSVMKKKKKKKS